MKKHVVSCLGFLLLFCLGMVACQMEKEEETEVVMTAQVNGEPWKFYDLEVKQTEDGMEITGLGYLNGERGAIGMNLSIKLLGINESSQLQPPFEAVFMPGTQDQAAIATIQPTDKQITYDTQLDANTKGLVRISQLQDGKISGSFNFIAKDKAGNEIRVEEGSFSGVPVER